MTPGSPIAVGHSLVSAGGIFELGFFAPGDANKRFLGIWFSNIKEKTVVWVANRDAPLEDDHGALNLTDDGNLALLSGAGIALWSTYTSSNATRPVLQLLDSGNLVLTGGASDNLLLWQSFDHPTDTILAGLNIGFDYGRKLDTYLTSWKSDSDPSPGEYSYRMDIRGVAQLVLWKETTEMYRSGPWTGKGFSGRPNMSPNGVFNFQYTDNQSGVYYTFQVLNATVLARATLDQNGRFQRFVWTEGSSEWKLFWEVPEGQCDQYASCGGNGICTMLYSSSCNCLEGFVPKSPAEWSLRQYSDGCVRGTPLNCSTDGFLQVLNVKLPDTVNATATNRTPDECSDWCRNNCSCTAYAVFEQSKCLTWFGDLVDVRIFADGEDVLHVRLAASELESLNGDSGKKKTMKIVSITLPIGILLFVCLCLVLWLKCRRRTQGMSVYSGAIMPGYIKSFRSKRDEEEELELPLFDILTIRTATNDFSNENIIGEGGFGPVYKGQLEDGVEIAVKRLSRDSVQGLREFKTEVMLIAKLQHKNLVRLIGCCTEEDERILVYEYLHNKSLDAFIFADKIRGELLDWQKRLEIIAGIARGLLYLHHDSRLKIIHRDLKTSNILLDHEMNPKISDFGTARIFNVDQIEENTSRVVGTYGYMSPEYAMEGIFSEKSDVFSFGVMVLEILSGKRSRTASPSEPCKNLLQHAWRLWMEGRCLELADEALEDSYSNSKVTRFIQVGLLCVQEGSDDRPTMEDVFLMLSSEDVTLPQPSRPAFYRASAFQKDWTSINAIRITKIEEGR
ncbi:unnamed protein product [Musa textilis]